MPQEGINLKRFRLFVQAYSGEELVRVAHLCRLAALAALLVLPCAVRGAALPRSSPCSNIPHSDHPSAYLTNGEADMVVFLPDVNNGYYRSSRFDWAGIIACASYRGHTYFGEWFNRYDPMLNDAVTGPVEEFRAENNQELGYTEAPVGGTFVKPGVGVLTKTADAPYSFGTVYPIADHGEWKVKVKKRSITFTQHLHSETGYSYEYTKTLELDAHRPVFTLKHLLKNTGTKVIETNVYDHDFFMLDNEPTGKQHSVEFGFTPVPEKPLGDAAEVNGNTITFTATPDREHHAMGYLRGFTGKPGEYKVHLMDSETGTGILQTSDSPVSKAYFWSTARTICPELYIPIHIQPGAKQQWDIQYELEAKKR